MDEKRVQQEDGVIRFATKALQDRAVIGPLVPVAGVLFEIVAAAKQAVQAYEEKSGLVLPMARLGTALQSLQYSRTSAETECLALLVRLEQNGFSDGEIKPDTAEAWLWTRLGEVLRQIPQDVKEQLLRDVAVGL